MADRRHHRSGDTEPATCASAGLGPSAEQAARLADALAAIDRLLLPTLTKDDVLSRLVGEVSQVAGADKCIVIEVSGDRYTATHVRGFDDATVGASRDAAWYPTFALTSREGRPLLIGDTWNDPRTNKEFVIPNALRAFALIPLSVEGEVVAVLALVYDEPRTFTEEDERFAARLSSAMSVAMSNAVLFEREREHARLSSAFADLDTAMHAETDPDEVVHVALALGLETLGADSGAVSTHDGSSFSIAYAVGFDENPTGVTIPYELEPHSVIALTTRRPVAVEDTRTDPRVDAGHLAAFGIGAVLVVPLVIRNDAVGNLYYNYARPRRFSEHELEFALRLGASLSDAVETARLVAELRDANEQLTTAVETMRAQEAALAGTSDSYRILAESARRLLAAEKPEASVQAIAEEVMHFLGCDVFFNYLLEEGAEAMRLNAYAGVDPETAASISELRLGQAVCGCVARDGVRIVAEDIAHSTDPRTGLVRGMGVQAYACHPLVYRGVTIGTLSFGTKQRIAFGPDELELMRAVADQAATAMARGRTESLLRSSEVALRKRTALLEGVNSLLQEAMRLETQDDLAEACVQIVERVTRSPFGFIGVLGDDDSLRDLAISNPGWDACGLYDRRGHDSVGPFPVRGLYGRVLRTGRAVLTNEPGKHPDHTGVPEGHPPLDAFLGVPLKSGRRVTGIIAVANREGGYRTEDRKLLEALAPAVNEALERKRAEQELEEANQRLDAHMFNSPLAVVEFDSESRVSRWSAEAERMFGWRADEVVGKSISEIPWVYEEDVPLVERENERLTTGTGRSVNVNRNYRKDRSIIWCEWYDSAIYDAQGNLVSILSQVLEITERKRAQEALEAERGRLRRIIDELPIGVHLLDAAGEILEVNAANDRIWGGPIRTRADMAKFHARHSDTNEAYGREDWPITQSIDTGLASEAVARIDPLDGGRPKTVRVTATPITDDGGMTGIVAVTEDITAEAEMKRLDDALTAIGTAVFRTLDVDDIVGETAFGAAAALGADALLATARHDDDRAVVTLARGWPEEVLGRTLGSSDMPARHEAGRKRRPVLTEGADTGIPGISSALYIPLIAQGRHLGTVVLAHTSSDGTFGDPARHFAGQVVSVASMALDNALAYERERTIAETLQEAVSAPPEPAPGVKAAYLYRPASQTANVGGDFYDMFEAAPGRVAIVVGDVSGKGLEAARLTSMMRDGIRAYAYESLDPCRVLDRVNTLAYRSSPVEAYATIFFAILDVASGQLDYCAAGHPPAIVANGTEARLLGDVTSPVVGAFDTSRYAAARSFLEVGETLVLYTDGVTEAVRAGELFGEERLLEAMRELSAVPLPDMPNAMLDRVLDYTGGSLRDDTVIVCVQREPADAPAAP